jgi:hypothetical protein
LTIWRFANLTISLNLYFDRRLLYRYPIILNCFIGTLANWLIIKFD